MLEEAVSRYAETRGFCGMKPVEDMRPTGNPIRQGSQSVESHTSYSVVKGSLALRLLVVRGLCRGASGVNGIF